MKRLLLLSCAAYPFLLLLLPFQFIPMLLPTTVRIIPAFSSLAVALILLLFTLRLLAVTARRATVRPYLFVGFAGACVVGLDADRDDPSARFFSGGSGNYSPRAGCGAAPGRRRGCPCCCP